MSIAEDMERLQQTRSRLSMSLEEVIADKGALGYFIQYLEARSVGGLIRFYLDVECFRSAAYEDARTSQTNQHQLNSSNEHKSNTGSSCDSLHSPPFRNDTEEENSVKAKDNVLQSNSDVYGCASVHSDAVRIFEKYLGLNASLPVPIEEDIRNSVALALCRQGFLDPDCFSSAQIVCYEIMEEE